jgi:AraC-like DNA-binding protein
LNGKREELTAGDIVVVPRGDPHFLGHGVAKPVDSLKTFAPGLNLVRFGGGGEVTKFVCGYLACDPRLSEVFLSGLPPLLKVHLVKESSDQWLENSIRFSVGETHGSNAGSELVHARLAELLFIETLRRYINKLPEHEIGWLAGARDQTISQALALLHKEPAYPWTISSLARKVGLSRTRLAERFRHFLSESPMAYLARWRLKLAAEILQSTEDSIAEIAVTVGYESEAGFNRAFKREFNCPPAQFRRQHKLGKDCLP